MKVFFLVAHIHHLFHFFEETSPDILALEFSTPRAGELDSLLSSEKIKENSILALGVINPRTDIIEFFLSQ